MFSWFGVILVSSSYEIVYDVYNFKELFVSLIAQCFMVVINIRIELLVCGFRDMIVVYGRTSVALKGLLYTVYM